MVDTDFLKFWFCLRAQILLLRTKLSIVFLEVTDLFCSFLRRCLPNAQVWITIVCQCFLCLFLKKACNSVAQPVSPSTLNLMVYEINRHLEWRGHMERVVQRAHILVYTRAAQRYFEEELLWWLKEKHSHNIVELKHQKLGKWMLVPSLWWPWRQDATFSDNTNGHNVFRMPSYSELLQVMTLAYSIDLGLDVLF